MLLEPVAESGLVPAWIARVSNSFDFTIPPFLDAGGGDKGTLLFDETKLELNPAKPRAPDNFECSILGHLSKIIFLLFFFAIFIASSLLIPNCIHIVFAPILIASFVIPGQNWSGLKIFTISIWKGISSREA